MPQRRRFESLDGREAASLSLLDEGNYAPSWVVLRARLQFVVALTQVSVVGQKNPQQSEKKFDGKL